MFSKFKKQNIVAWSSEKYNMLFFVFKITINHELSKKLKPTWQKNLTIITKQFTCNL